MATYSNVLQTWTSTTSYSYGNTYVSDKWLDCVGHIWATKVKKEPKPVTEEELLSLFEDENE